MRFHFFKALAALIVAAAPLAGHAAVYKCVDAAGKTSFQEQECPQSSSGSEMAIRQNSGPALSAEDKAWVADSSKKLIEGCIYGFGRRPELRNLDAKAGREICECSSSRYFADNPISRLKALEKARDVKANSKLVSDAMASCIKERAARQSR